MTMSCVAEEKPSATAPTAMAVSPASTGSVFAINTNAPMMPTCASSIHERRWPSRRPSTGSGSLSTKGAQTNLNE